MTTTPHNGRPLAVQLRGLGKSFHGPHSLVRAVHRLDVGVGEIVALLGPNGAGKSTAIAAGDSPLTQREHEVLSAARSHETAADIASALYLSEGTVRNYLSSAIRKLGARNRNEAIDFAVEQGWL